jgi:hypothetical protein
MTNHKLHKSNKTKTSKVKTQKQMFRVPPSLTPKASSQVPCPSTEKLHQRGAAMNFHLLLKLKAFAATKRAAQMHYHVWKKTQMMH